MPTKSPSTYTAEGNGTAWFIGIVIGLVLLAMGYLITSANAPRTTPTISLASSSVLLSVGGGHGSGVYIGNGYVLTAGHVAAHGAPTLETDGITAETTVLWVNTDYDLALLHTDAKGIAAAPLACAPLAVGQVLRAEGNPLLLTDIRTDLKVAGVPRQTGPWHSIVPVDGTVVPGMSGGPAYDAMGRVAHALKDNDVHYHAFRDALLGMRFIVPSTAVCELLATSANIID